MSGLAGLSRLYAAAVRFQFTQFRRSVNELMTLIIMPLFAVAFLSILVNSGRRDLAPIAVVGSAMMAIWTMALWSAGSMIQQEQWEGTFEAVAGTPAPYAVVLVGRISAVTVVSFVGLIESILVAWIGFGVVIHIPHPGVFALTLLCSAVAVAGTGTVMSVLFVAGRSAGTFQNSMTYPFYVLSGAVVPISLLPGWIQPLSKVVFLSWTAQLLRDTLQPRPLADVPFRLGVITWSGLAAFALAFWLVGRVLRRHRDLGTLGWQ